MRKKRILPTPEEAKARMIEFLKNNPITPFLDNRADLFKWTVIIHNYVNKMLKKPEWTEYEVIKYYERLGNR